MAQCQLQRRMPPREPWVAAKSSSPTPTSGSLQARINEANLINVNARGFKRGTLWFKSGMIDFDKPVTIRVNGKAIYANRKIAPSLATLMEDFRARGDHQRVFLAKFEFDL